MKKKMFILWALFLTITVWAQEGYTHYEVRYATNPKDAKNYDTQRTREEYLVPTIFEDNKVHMVYTMHDRMIIGGAKPVNQSLRLEAIEPIKSSNFTEHREVGIINIGGKGIVQVGNKKYELNPKDALYIGRGKDEVTFSSVSADNPALFYFNSATAHKSYPTKKITQKEAPTIENGNAKEANARSITKYILHDTMPTCQLQMGMTELKEGSVWNTMPPHTHGRRMEAYLYFNLPEEQAVAHFMGEGDSTQQIWVHNQQAVISPEWSIHSGVGTQNYTFIWGMAGENLDYTDLDPVSKEELQ
ncbi:5-dehydro-4-deoxy-D-glucuronate isomerase [Weeksellaceae bacterium TAE3-ERU29]|nr:5-dehydro-4-deoxy-D-glucuronate isomerase [Weeksellaceae bacterium TAE3-ERU29]